MVAIISRSAVVALAITSCGCARVIARPLTGGPDLQPMTFFMGRTHGDGELDKVFSRPVRVAVDSIGRRQGDMLVLDQTIHEGRSPPSVRRWTMRPVGIDRYSGTLTDAAGQVSVVVSGSHAHIRYKTRSGFDIEQELVLQSDGKTVLNRLRAHKLGIRVAALDETIHKLN